MSLVVTIIQINVNNEQNLLIIKCIQNVVLENKEKSYFVKREIKNLQLMPKVKKMFKIFIRDNDSKMPKMSLND